MPGAIRRFWNHVVWRRVKNLCLTFKDVLFSAKKERTVFAAQKVARARIKACEACDHFDSIRQCDICGCFMDAKTKFYAARCSLVDKGEESRWPR
jgi:hypothetical protein